MVTHYATIAQGFAFEMKFGNCLTRFEYCVLFEFKIFKMMVKYMDDY